MDSKRTKSFIYMYPFFLKGFPDSSIGEESTCNAGDPGLISGSGRSAGKGVSSPLQYSWGSFVAQLVKNPPAMWETWVQPWVGKIPWRRERLPTPIFGPGEFHRVAESDTTEQLSLHFTSLRAINKNKIKWN